MRTSFVKKNVTKEMRDKRQAEIDVRKPHFKVLVNIFYELVSIQYHLLSLIVKDFEYIRYGEEFQDKQRMNRIGERCCQLVIVPIVTPTFVEVETLSETERGDGGYGSTGK